MIRYATKQVTVDGRVFNIGDIVPESYLASAAGIENWTRGEGEPMPAPEATAVKPATSFSATEDVQDTDEEDATEEAETETETEESATETEEATTEEATVTEEVKETPSRRRSR